MHTDVGGARAGIIMAPGLWIKNVCKWAVANRNRSEAQHLRLDAVTKNGVLLDIFKLLRPPHASFQTRDRIQTCGPPRQQHFIDHVVGRNTDELEVAWPPEIGSTHERAHHTKDAYITQRRGQVTGVGASTYQDVHLSKCEDLTVR